jgi:hypothetical protein
VYSNIIITINGLHIMNTLNNVYFEHIKLLCKIFVQYIVPILQVYQNQLIIFPKMILNEIYYYNIIIIIIITCDKKRNLIKFLK